MKIFWNASWVPEAAVRTTSRIGPETFAPGTWLHCRTRPEKICWTVVWERLPTGLALFVIRQIASCAIGLNECRPGRRLRVARGVADRHPAVGDVGDADVRAALEEAELHHAGRLHVRLRELGRERGDRGRPLIVIAAWPRRGRNRASAVAARHNASRRSMGRRCIQTPRGSVTRPVRGRGLRRVLLLLFLRVLAAGLASDQGTVRRRRPSWSRRPARTAAGWPSRCRKPWRPSRPVPLTVWCAPAVPLQVKPLSGISPMRGRTGHLRTARRCCL